jgi:hypothetical protein
MIPLALAACGMLWASTATATELTFSGLVTYSGTGIGSELTALVLQNDPTEVGSVAPPLVNNNKATLSGDASNQSMFYSIHDLATSAAQITRDNLGVILQVNQTGSNGNQGSITLSSFSLDLYDQSANLLASERVTYNGPIDLQGVGVGHAGYLFTPETPLSDAWLVPTNIVGMSGDFSNSHDGPETFFFVNAGATQLAPEPSSATLLAVSAIGLTVYAWRRRRQVMGA